MSRIHYDYGCMPPKFDVRDYKLSKSVVKLSLPESYEPADLPRVKNQRSVSSCVAHATSCILEYHDLYAGNNILSTNFIYGIQRQLCGHEGSGMYLRDACKIVKEYGDMLESDCPGNYEVPKSWTIAELALSNKTYKDKATNFKIASYFNCSDTTDIKRAIFNYGPVLGSIKWYDTFECNEKGVLEGEQKGPYGYHAIMIYGWNETGLLCQNSWGKSWGNDGCFILPYNIPVAEAKGLVDYDSDAIVKPKRGKCIDIFYKIINWMLNLFKK